jgi:hypothetical protein
MREVPSDGWVPLGRFVWGGYYAGFAATRLRKSAEAPTGRARGA